MEIYGKGIICPIPGTQQHVNLRSLVVLFHRDNNIIMGDTAMGLFVSVTLGVVMRSPPPPIWYIEQM